MKMKKRLILLNLLLAICILAASCGISGTATDKADGGYGSDSANYEQSISEEGRVSTGASKSEAAPDADDSADPGSGDSSDLENRKLIKDANLRIQTREFDNFMSNLQYEITRAGGFVQRSEVSGNSYTYESMRGATVVARIPAAKLDEFTGILSVIGNVTNKSESLQDITMSYVDTESHIKALKTEQESLLALMAKATTLTDILAVQSQLTNVRYQLDSYESKLRKYDDLISYSTVTMNITEVERVTETDKKNTWEQIASKFADNLYAVGRSFRSFFIWFVSSLPIFAVIIVIAAAVALIIMASLKCRRRRKAKKASVL